jgi:hypothetical protein
MTLRVRLIELLGGQGVSLLQQRYLATVFDDILDLEDFGIRYMPGRPSFGLWREAWNTIPRLGTQDNNTLGENIHRLISNRQSWT